MRRCLLMLTVLVLLVGCRAESILPPTPTPGTVLPESTPSLVPPDNTPTSVVPTAPTGAWRFREPRTTDNPALVQQAEGFALDPNWQIARVEYSYNWWGLSSEPDLENQVVQRNGERFTRDNLMISADAMEAFVAAIARFQPTQAYVYGNSWTDDYPNHTIELTGEDGQQLLFISTSTGNPGDGPWNLVYNDKLYAQYDGAFGYGLEEIFDYEMRGTVGEMFGSSTEYEPEVHFSTNGLPLQLEYGFDGLLPIAESFVYHADLQNQTISGSLVGRSSIGGFGNMVIGTFPSLESITLTTPEAITCDAEAIEMDDPVGAAWTFTCSIPTAQAEMPFLYPITVVLQNDKGVPTTVTGNLSGMWSETPRPLRLPLPPFLQSALEGNPDAATILGRHEYAIAGYSASLEPEPPNAIRTLSGDITLFGTTTHNGQPLLYRLTTPFEVKENGELGWYLTPADLDTLIADTLALPETRNLVKAYPATTLHLGYFPPIEQQRRFMESYQNAMPTAYPAWCGTEPSADEEAPATLVRSVGYILNDSSSTLFGGIDDNGQFRTSYARLALGETVPSVIFPDGTVLNEGYLSLSRSGGWNSLTFGFDPADATEERVDRFEALAEEIGAELNYSDSTAAEHPEWWVNTAYALQVTNQGDLELVACE
jgi:hypothetical protein